MEQLALIWLAVITGLTVGYLCENAGKEKEVGVLIDSSKCQCLTCSNSEDNGTTRNCSKGVMFCTKANCASCRWAMASCGSYDKKTDCAVFLPLSKKSKRTCSGCGYFQDGKCRIGKAG